MAEQLKLNPMTGEFDLVGQADSDTLGTLLSGYASTTGTITASDSILTAIEKLNGNFQASGSGTVMSVSVVTANGVSGSVATDTTTPAITLTLGAITPSTVNGLDLDALTVGFSIAGGVTSKTLTVSDNATVSGSNTGDQTLASLGAEATANKVTSISAGSTDAQYPSAKLLYDQLATKQPTGSYLVASDISGKEDSSNKVTTISSGSTDAQYPSAKLVYDQLAGKQATGSYLTGVTCDSPLSGAGTSGSHLTVDLSSKQNASTNLTSIAGLATTVGLVKQTSANTFGIDATAYASTTITAGKANFHGVEAVGTISFNASTHALTLASITYWYKGVQYTTASPVVCDLDLTADRDNSSNTLTTNKLYFFYFKDATGKLYWSDASWNFKENVFVATVYWNGSAGAVQRETHNHTRDLDWHIWSHDTIGCRYESGFALTNPTTVNDALLQIETGTIHDEDLDVATGQITTMRGWYQASAGVYTFADFSLPYLGTSGTPQYLRTSDYSLQAVGATNFAVYWVYATLDIDRPCYVVPTQATAPHNTIALARAEVAPTLLGLGINAEWKLIYKFIYKGDGNFQESVDFRSSSPVPGGGTSSVTAGAVSFSPYSGIASTNVQSALQELEDEKQAINANLTSISALATTVGLVKQTSANTFAIDATAYLTSLAGAVLTDQSTPQTIGATGARLGMLWVTDITCTNAITGSVTGNAGTVTNGIYTTSQVTALAAVASGDKDKYLHANASTGALEWSAIVGGFVDPMTTRGDIIVRGASSTTRLALGTNGQVLVSDGTDIKWGSATTGLFDIDVNGDLEPIAESLADDFYELDVNDDLQPKA